MSPLPCFCEIVVFMNNLSLLAIKSLTNMTHRQCGQIRHQSRNSLPFPLAEGVAGVWAHFLGAGLFAPLHLHWSSTRPLSASCLGAHSQHAAQGDRTPQGDNEKKGRHHLSISFSVIVSEGLYSLRTLSMYIPHASLMMSSLVGGFPC